MAKISSLSGSISPTKHILNDGIGILLTDTIYGVIAKASSQSATEKVYVLKGRAPEKPPIVLITDTGQMFDMPSEKMIKDFELYWPGKNSIILPSPSAPEWITRGTKTVAYRLISTNTASTKILYDIINKTGPLIAPSANPEGLPPARNIAEAKKYFGDKVDFYIDGGYVKDNAPSKLYKWTPQVMKRLR